MIRLPAQSFPIQDERAEWFSPKKQWPVADLVDTVLGDTGFWGTDLRLLPGFAEAVLEKLQLIQQHGIRDALT